MYDVQSQRVINLHSYSDENNEMCEWIKYPIKLNESHNTQINFTLKQNGITNNEASVLNMYDNGWVNFEQ